MPCIIKCAHVSAPPPPLPERKQVERMNNLSMPVMPYYCTDVIRQCIKKGLTDHPQKFGAQAVARGIDIPVSQLSMQFADMARCVFPGLRHYFPHCSPAVSTRVRFRV